MYTFQQRLVYAKRLQRLQQAVVIKDNIHLTYKYKNRNKAYANVESIQDRINKAIIEDAVNGNAESIKGLEKQGEKLIHDTLTDERKRLHQDKKHKAVNHATKSNSQYFTDIFNYRRKKIGESLEDKIEKELRKNKYVNLSDADKIQELNKELGDYGKKRLKNIITDAMHTNESNIGFIKAIEDGFNYKIWKNGRGKGKTRAWHKAKHIQAVPIDETFDIYGSYPAHMMYPGDLNGGAENVANCRCWLLYTNNIPKNLRRTQFAINEKFSFNKIKNNFVSKLNEKSVKKLIEQYKSYDEDFKKSINKCRDKLKKLYPTPNLNSNENLFLVTWGRDSSPLNLFLRGVKKIPFWEFDYYERYLKNLNNAINKYNNIKHNTILHRNISGGFFIADVGKIGTFETPISTTFNKNAIKDYGDFHITILAPEGSNGAYIEEIMKKGNSKNHNLDEWLLPLGTKYKTLYKNYKTKEAVIILLT